MLGSSVSCNLLRLEQKMYILTFRHTPVTQLSNVVFFLERNIDPSFLALQSIQRTCHQCHVAQR